MKQNFDRILDELLLSEGGFVNHPSDPGGATNLGVTLATAKRLGIDVDKDGDTDVNDIKLLKREHAAQVFKSEFWDKVKGDELPHGLDYAVVDFAYHSGPKRAVIGLQRLLGLADDGILGPHTLAAVKSYQFYDTLINRYMDDRVKFLKSLSTFSVFGKGWMNRIVKVRKISLELATHPEQEQPKKFNFAALIPVLITMITALWGLFRSQK